MKVEFRTKDLVIASIETLDSLWRTRSRNAARISSGMVSGKSTAVGWSTQNYLIILGQFRITCTKLKNTRSWLGRRANRRLTIFRRNIIRSTTDFRIHFLG